ncbi:MAG: NADH-quinone oxidoreductase subunit NuoH [Anaerosomatales bacterium]|nr:NADH-quinone oxidoreductase subunit NuoH [Anaerosomatales bacterium]MDT8433498.1 NADH-quinone oxidoreductase subunit NuoH [Anaerosomatales bacterium]
MSGLAWGALYGLAAGLVIAVAALIGVWGERKVAGRIQMRIGPQELGPFGLLQTLADTLKLVLKEDITPAAADVRIFRIAPLIVFAPIAMSFVIIPYASGFAPLDTSVGILFFMAVPAISVIGVLLAGWSSRNTYATIGGLRAAAQMISYELPRTLSILPFVLLAGSMRPLDIMDEWRWWWIPLTFIAFVVYFISSIAEVNRGPFDLPEAESELVAGYFADYSGIRWAIFMMAEYGGMVAAALFGAVFWFGGYLHLPGAFGVIMLIAMATLLAIGMIWVKWTFPRMRPDQLMGTAWKVLTPMALVQLVIIGVVIPWL